MRLHLIRHAESENNARPVRDRVCDPAITAIGRLQGEHLGDWMSRLRLDALVTSPFLRTLQTTSFVLRRRPQPVHVWHNVFERGGCYHGHEPANFAGADGLGRSGIVDQLASTQPVTLDDQLHETGWWGRRDREDDDTANARAAEVIERIEATFAGTDQDVALIVHADFIRCLLRPMLDGVLDIDSIGPIPNVSVTRLDWTPGRWKLVWLNSVTHLPPRLITGMQPSEPVVGSNLHSISPRS